MMIGTLDIVQKLSGSIGQAGARDLASVLEEYREDLRQNLLKQEFAELRTVVRELAEAQNRTEDRLGRLETVVAELAEAQKRTEKHVGELVEAQNRTEEALQRLIERVEAHEVRLAKLDGRTLESQFREKASAFLGTVLRGTRVVPVGDLGDELDQVLSEDEWADLTLADVILRGRAVIAGERQEVYAVVEVSVILEQDDVNRAARRAALLRKKGWKVLAVVAGEEADPRLIEQAAQMKVAVLQNGQQFNWPKAIEGA